MATNIYAPVVLALLLLGACGKKEEPTKPKAVLRVFTKGAEIKDAGVKQRFAAKSLTPFTTPDDTPDPNAIVQFVAPDTATFPPTSLRFSVKHAGEQYLFYSLVSFQASADDIVYRLLKHTAPRVPYLTGASFQYRTQEVRVGYGNSSSMRLAVLYYRIKRASPGGGYSEMSGQLFNEFNPDVVGSIGLNDTLAVMETSLPILVR